MIEFYPQVKWLHVAAVLVSGTLFLLRGLLLQLGRERLALGLPLRISSWTIDTLLLTAALMLLTMLPKAMFANGWLAAKLVLLIVYVVLGHRALRRAGTPRARLVTWLVALLVYGHMIGVARSHHPLGFLHGWLA